MIREWLNWRYAIKTKLKMLYFWNSALFFSI